MHVRVLRRDPERDVSGGGIRAGKRGARLDRVGDQPMVDEMLLDDARGSAKRGLRLVLVSQRPAEADVALRFVVQVRRSRLHRADRLGDDGQRLVVDLDQIGAVLGSIARLGDDHRHRVAHEAHDIGGQWQARRRDNR